MNSNNIKILLFIIICAVYDAGAQTDLTATGFDSHVELNWTAINNTSITGYQIWFSQDGVNFTQRKLVTDTRFILDFVNDIGTNLKLYYKVKPVLAGGSDSPFSNIATATTHNFSDDELLTMVQQYTFHYFNEFAHPISGMARERNTSGDIVTTGGTGFGITAWIVAAERGFVTRNQAIQQLYKITNFLSLAQTFHGAFPHWMNGVSGKVIPFSQYDNGGDLVETAFLMEGLLTARQYFNGANDDEKYLRAAITQLWEQVDWSWYRKDGGNVLYWHWSPNYAWKMNFPIRGYNEALIIYLLAIASPTHPIPASLYHTGWAANNNYRNAGIIYYGEQLQVSSGAGGPLFFTHYSYLGFDPRNKHDAYANYFTNNVSESKINRSYCIANPGNYKDYSSDCWGLTASDDPNGYSAHAPLENDNGTITPTAALSSMPYTPEAGIAALKNFYRIRGSSLFGSQGFYDAFNPQRNWVANSYLAIDEGPIVGMIENYRTGLIWKNFMLNSEIKPALDAIGFKNDATATETVYDNNINNVKIFPNPVFFQESILSLNLNREEIISAYVVDGLGRTKSKIFSDKKFLGGQNDFKFNVSDLANGTYFINLKSDTEGDKFFKFIILH